MYQHCLLISGREIALEILSHFILLNARRDAVVNSRMRSTMIPPLENENASSDAVSSHVRARVRLGDVLDAREEHSDRQSPTLNGSSGQMPARASEIIYDFIAFETSRHLWEEQHAVFISSITIFTQTQNIFSFYLISLHCLSQTITKRTYDTGEVLPT